MKSQAFGMDVEPIFDKNLIENINQLEGENEKLNDEIKLLERKKNSRR